MKNLEQKFGPACNTVFKSGNIKLGRLPIIMKNLQQKFGSASNNYEKVVTEIWAGTVGPMAPWGQWRIFT